MCFIHLFVASSCQRGGDEAIIGQQRLFEIGFRDYSSELFTCPSKDDYWIWDFTQGHEDEPEGDKRSSFCRKIMEFFFCLQHFLILLWIWIKASKWTELLSGSCWPFLVCSTQHSTVYSGIVAHSSTLRTTFLFGRLRTVRQSESCGNAFLFGFQSDLDKKLVISTPLLYLSSFTLNTLRRLAVLVHFLCDLSSFKRGHCTFWSWQTRSFYHLEGPTWVQKNWLKQQL